METAEYAEEAAESAERMIESTEETVESAKGMTESAEETKESAERMIESTEETAESTEEMMESMVGTKEAAESAERMIESAEETAESAEEMMESMVEAKESAEEAAEEEGESAEEEEFAEEEGLAEEIMESAEESAESAEEAAESAEEAAGSAEEEEESAEEMSPIPSTLICSLCKNTTLDPVLYPLGLFCHVVINYAAEQNMSNHYSVLMSKSDGPLADTDDQSVRITDLMMKKFDFFCWKCLNVFSPKFSNFVYVPAGIDVRTCGHYVHFTCFRNYIGLNHYDPSQSLLEPHVIEWAVKQLCPTCICPSSCLLPIVPRIKFPRKRLNILNENTTVVSLTETIDKLIFCGDDELNNKIYQKLPTEGITITLCSARRIMISGEQTGCMAYRELFSKFIALCHKWTDHYRDVYCDDRARIQCSAIGILKTVCEMNVISSELCFKKIPQSELFSKTIIYGIRYVADTLDLKFAKYEWKKLTLGYDPLAPELLNLDYNFLEHSRLAQLYGIKPSQVSGENTGEKNEEIIKIPMVLFNLKTTLIRLSSYVITSDWLFDDEKKVLLRFIYQMILLAIIIRTAILSVIRMPLSQVLLAFYSTSMSSRLFVFVMRIVIKTIMSTERVSAMGMTNLLSHNEIQIDYELALQDACTDFSRFTLQLWHECGIQVYDENYRVGHETFMNIYELLTGENTLPLYLLPAVRVERWTDEVMQWFRFQNFRQRLYKEPLKWHRFTLIKPPRTYNELYLSVCFRQCIKCQCRATDQYLCFVCGRLLNLDRKCFDMAKYLTFHARKCANGATCFLSILNRSILIILDQLGAIWGNVYVEASESDLSCTPEFILSEEYFQQLIEDWTLKSFRFNVQNVSDLLDATARH